MEYLQNTSKTDLFLILFLVVYIICVYKVPIELSILLTRPMFKVIIVISIIYLCYHNILIAILLSIAYVLTIVSEKKKKKHSLKEHFENYDDDDEESELSDLDTEDSDDNSEEEEEEGTDTESDIDDDNLEQYRTDNPAITDNFKKLHDTLHNYEKFLKQK